MPKLKLKTRYKAAGDVFNALLAIGFDPDTASDFMNDIKDADVVEVIRCLHCKHYGFTKIAGESYMTCKNPFGLTDPASTDFCISGEREEHT